MSTYSARGRLNERYYFDLWQALEEALPEWAIDLRDITRPSPFADLVRQTEILIYERKNSTESIV